MLAHPKRLLAPVDFTAATQYSAKYACALAREHQAELVLIHVIEDVPRGAMADLECLKHTVEQSLKEVTVRGEAQDRYAVYRCKWGRLCPRSSTPHQI